MPLLNPPLPLPLPRLRRSRRSHPTLPNLPDLEFLPADERPLRIALVTEYYYPHLGGVCEHVHFFAREARRRGHHVDLSRHFEANWPTIPIGLDTAVFHPSAPPPPGVNKDIPTILFLGRFDPRNGLTTLIDSFQRVKSKGARARQARLVVVGDGPLR